jgi:hypothetical protein
MDQVYSLVGINITRLINSYLLLTTISEAILLLRSSQKRYQFPGLVASFP